MKKPALLIIVLALLAPAAKISCAWNLRWLAPFPLQPFIDQRAPWLLLSWGVLIFCLAATTTALFAPRSVEAALSAGRAAWANAGPAAGTSRSAGTTEAKIAGGKAAATVLATPFLGLP